MNDSEKGKLIAGVACRIKKCKRTASFEVDEAFSLERLRFLGWEVRRGRWICNVCLAEAIRNVNISVPPSRTETHGQQTTEA